MLNEYRSALVYYVINVWATPSGGCVLRHQMLCNPIGALEIKVQVNAQDTGYTANLITVNDS